MKHRNKMKSYNKTKGYKKKESQKKLIFKMKMARLKKSFSVKMPDVLDIPEEILLDLPKIILIGQQQVLIENHHGIIEYLSETIKIQSGSRTVEIKGEQLIINNILPEELLIEGKIKSLQFI